MNNSVSERLVPYALVGMRMCVLCASFVTNILIARALGATGRGDYALALAFAVLFATLGSFSIEQGVTDVFAKKVDGGHSVIDSALVLGLSVVSLATVLGSVIFSIGPFGVDSRLWLVAGGLIWASGVHLVFQRLLLLIGRPILAAGIALGEASTILAVTGVWIGWRQLTPEVALWILCIAMTSSALASIGFLAPRLSRVSRKHWRNILSRGSRYHFGQTALMLLMRVDLLLLGALAHVSEAGIYSVAMALTAPVAVVGTSVAQASLARQIGLKEADAAVLMTLQIVRSCAAWVGIVCLILALTVIPLVDLVWGGEFGAASRVTLLLLPGAFFLSVQRPIGQLLVGRGDHGAMNRRATHGLLANCTLCLILIPELGATGAALAASAAYLVYAASSFGALRKISGVGRTKLLVLLVRPHGTSATSEVKEVA